ncbi:MAG TPA: helix-turn-helix transcriptional regulator [Opitutaceae bacterium]|nr:helix-turn-helix transcriptional regulator [Opitutaceae bacterium]
MNSPTQAGDRTVLRTLVERVRQQRLSRLWTQAEAARRAGLSRSAYQDFEAGVGNITLLNLSRVLGIFNLSDRLAELVPPPTAPVTLPELLKKPRVRGRKSTAQ